MKAPLNKIKAPWMLEGPLGGDGGLGSSYLKDDLEEYDLLGAGDEFFTRPLNWEYLGLEKANCW